MGSVSLFLSKEEYSNKDKEMADLSAFDNKWREIKNKSVAKKEAKRERLRQQIRFEIKNDPEFIAEFAKELLSRGFLNEALGRNLKTRAAKDFYQSKAWASARYAALLKADGKCRCCGANAAEGAKLHVDHIKPRSKYPQLALELSNLQVLCDLCNVAKSNIDQTDWTAKPATETAYSVYMEEDRRIHRIARSIAQER